MSKKVLMITYLFPPAGGTGTVRVTKFAKYICLFGWKPIILTSYDVGISVDSSGLEDLHEDTCVRRVSGLAPRQWAKQYRGRLKTHDPRPRRDVPQQARPPADDAHRARLLRWLISFIQNYLLIPDHAIFWAPNAILRGVSLVRQYDIQVIYATGGPWSSHLVGYGIKKLTGKPLALDFRDPWAASGLLNRWRAVIDGYLERKVVEYADEVIAVTPEVLRDFAQRYPDSDGKLALVPNGFDEMDYESHRRAQAGRRGKANGVFSIVYTGTVGRAFLKPFLLAIKRVIANSIAGEDRIQVQFVGRVYRDSYGKDLYEYVEDCQLEEVVRIDGYAPRKEVSRIQTEADVLLVTTDQGQTEWGTISGKIYEYTAAERPILALVSPGGMVTTNYLKATGAGVWAMFDDVDGIASKVKLLYETGGSFLKRNEQEIAKYSRKALARHLAGVLNTCVQ